MLAQLWDQCYLFVDDCTCGTGTPKERAMTSRWIVVSALSSCLHWPVSGPRPSLCVQTDRQGRQYDITTTASVVRGKGNSGNTILQLRALRSEGKATAAVRYYNYGLCVQRERQQRQYDITTTGSVFRGKGNSDNTILQLRALCSEWKATAAIWYYNYGICVQRERQQRQYDITTTASVVRGKGNSGNTILQLRHLCSDAKTRAAIQYYDCGICVQTERRWRICDYIAER